MSLKVITLNRHGLLMDISTVLAEAKVSVVAAKIATKANRTAEIQATIEVANLAQLQGVMTKIGQFSDVISVMRTFGRTAAS